MANNGARGRASNYIRDGRRRRIPYNHGQDSSTQHWDQSSYSQYYDEERHDAYYDQRSSDGYHSSYHNSSSQPSAHYDPYNTGPSHGQYVAPSYNYSGVGSESSAVSPPFTSYPARPYNDFDPYAEDPFVTGYLDDVLERPAKRHKRRHDMVAHFEVDDISGDVKLRMEDDRRLFVSLVQPSVETDASLAVTSAEDTHSVTLAGDSVVDAPEASEDARAIDNNLADAPCPNASSRLSSGPSQVYLEALETQSEYSESPQDRKLLILDLNGTLVFRAGPRSAGHNRRVFARPYFEAFRQYILHSKTNIDVMVWSSAQPQNVADMVSKCFGRSYTDLTAIWDRTYFDLSKADYNKKSVTIKDLEKPWAYFTRLVQSDSTNKGVEHSVRTTLLLDDSTVKAQLQPYNHLCLREYDEDATRAARGLVLRQTANPAPEDTLLAIIGVLEHARHESHIARWVRDGGLWAGQDSPHTTAKNLPPSSSPPPPDGDETEVASGNGAAINLIFSPSKQAPEPMWFDRPATYAHWVNAGRDALKNLNIPVEPGKPSEPLQLRPIS